MPSHIHDLVVIGGGILGLSHAAAALSRGLRVALLERDACIAQASVRNFGLLTSLYNDAGPWGARAARSRAIYESWSRTHGLPLTINGAIQLAVTRAQDDGIRALATALAGARYLSADAVRAAATALPVAQSDDAPLYGGLHLSNDGLLEPRHMFAPASIAALLKGADVRLSTAAVALSRGEPDCTRVLTSTGDVLQAAHVVVCPGADALGLLPGLVTHEDAARLRLCKLQMMRVAIPRRKGDDSPPLLHPTLTSGLSLRRYPALHAFAPAEAKELAKDVEGHEETAAAEALGIHIIARPVTSSSPSSSSHASSDGGSYREFIVGDSHEYIPLSGAFEGGGDVINEGVTNGILRAARGMLRGIAPLHSARRKGVNTPSTADSCSTPHARIRAQWQGVYLQHDDGLFAVDARMTSDQFGGGHVRVDKGGDDARVHVVSGIGGKGMTMGPALGEEHIAHWFR